VAARTENAPLRIVAADEVTLLKIVRLAEAFSLETRCVCVCLCTFV